MEFPAQRGRYIGPNNDLFRLSCEISPYPAGARAQTAHFDAARLAKPTISSTTTVRRYMDRSAPAREGIGTLYLGSSGDYCEFPYTTIGSSWKGSGNALSGLNWSIGGWWLKSAALSGAGGYMVSVQDSGRTAAGTALKFTCDAAGTPTFSVSDGTTIFDIKHPSATAQMVFPGAHYLYAEAVNGIVYFSCDGSVLDSLNLGAINVPSSAVMRFGKSVAGDLTFVSAFADMWQLKPDHLYSGGNFTPPTWPVPYRITPRRSALPPPAVLMRFEDSPGFLVDEGTAGSTWTNSNGVQSTSSPKEGAKCLTFAGETASTYYLSTTATTANCMNGSGDCAMGGWFKTFADTSSGYFFGIREGDASAPNSGVFFARGGGANSIYAYWSDGTTISSLTDSVGRTGGAWVHLWIEQYTQSGTKKIFYYVDGSLVAGAGTAFSGSIPIPSGASLRIGSPAYTVSGGAVNSTAAADLFQVIQYSKYKGATSFTPSVRSF